MAWDFVVMFIERVGSVRAAMVELGLFSKFNPNARVDRFRILNYNDGSGCARRGGKHSPRSGWHNKNPARRTGPKTGQQKETQQYALRSVLT